MHKKENLKTCSTIPADECSAERFYENLSTGLHALAQPLTVLRSVTSALTHLPLEAADRERYTAITAEQVERACGIFHTLQNLLVASQNEPVFGTMDIASLLAPIIKDQKEVLRESGVRLKATVPAGLPPLHADMDRTLQALFAVLKIAAALSERHSVIELRATAWHDSIELSIRNESVSNRRMNASERLSLAVAEANIRSQNGKCESGEEPFHFSLSLPVLKKSPRNLTVLRNDDVLHGTRAHSFV